MSEVSAPIATFSREELKSRDKLEELRECFHDFGGVIVKELIDKATIKQFKASFIKLMSNVYEDILNDRLPTHDQDQLYLNLRTRAPEHASSLMGLGRDFPEYFRLVGSLASDPIFFSILSTRHIQIVHDVCLFRIDSPDCPETGFDWHQDYPFNMLSRNAVTVWCPILDVTTAMGPIEIVPKSHKQLFPVTIKKSVSKKKFVSQRNMVLSQLKSLSPGFEKRSICLPEMIAGDAFIFHSHLVHRSNTNKSDKCRWIFNPRFGDFGDAELTKRCWFTARSKYPYLIKDIHQELVC
ncbi:MAG: phytanoyl-CoA dioxygenase family protein [Pseudomonadota bacterium]|nr:phytanoyl-CoA dioxygenase family protein [Pseudomonadota bacterium]